MGGDIFRYSLNVSVVNIGIFIVFIVTDLSCSNNFSKDAVMFQYNRRKHLLFKRLN